MKQTATLHMPGGCIRVEWENDALTALLNRFFTPWHAKNSICAAGPPCTVTVAVGQNGYHITSPLSPPVSCTTIPELAMRFEEILTGLALTILESALLIHAAAVDLNGCGALIAGDHGMGKTTLTLTALSSGFKALSDEVGVIPDTNRSLSGFPRPFHVSADVMRLRPPIIPDACEPLGITDDYFLIFCERYYAPSSTLSCIVFPDRRPGKTTIERVGELEALRRLLPLGFNFYRAPDGRASDVAHLLKAVKAFTLRYEDHWEAVESIRDLLEKA